MTFEYKTEEVKRKEIEEDDIRSYNVGDSDYSKHKIQPWDLWIDYQLNPFDADIVKRVLRHKKSQSRIGCRIFLIKDIQETCLLCL